MTKVELLCSLCIQKDPINLTKMIESLDISFLFLDLKNKTDKDNSQKLILLE